MLSCSSLLLPVGGSVCPGTSRCPGCWPSRSAACWAGAPSATCSSLAFLPTLVPAYKQQKKRDGRLECEKDKQQQEAWTLTCRPEKKKKQTESPLTCWMKWLATLSWSFCHLVAVSLKMCPCCPSPALWWESPPPAAPEGKQKERKTAPVRRWHTCLCISLFKTNIFQASNVLTVLDWLWLLSITKKLNLVCMCMDANVTVNSWNVSLVPVCAVTDNKGIKKKKYKAI